MHMIHKFRSYLLDEEFELNLYKNRIHIINYVSIGHFDSNKVIINYDEGSIVIKGKNLVVSRLMNDEILVKGDFQNIELRWLNEK